MHINIFLSLSLLLSPTSLLWHLTSRNYVDALRADSRERTDISDFFRRDTLSSWPRVQSSRIERDFCRFCSRRAAHERAIDAQVHFWWGEGDAGKRGTTHRFRRDRRCTSLIFCTAWKWMDNGLGIRANLILPPSLYVISLEYMICPSPFFGIILTILITSTC